MMRSRSSCSTRQSDVSRRHELAHLLKLLEIQRMASFKAEALWRVDFESELPSLIPPTVLVNIDTINGSGLVWSADGERRSGARVHDRLGYVEGVGEEEH